MEASLHRYVSPCVASVHSKEQHEKGLKGEESTCYSHPEKSPSQRPAQERKAAGH